MDRYVGIGEAAEVLGVSMTTLRRWEADGKWAAEHTAGGHRRYDLAKLRPELYRAAADAARKTIAYARVSSHDQKADLERQKQVLELYCAQQGWTFEVIADLGSVELRRQLEYKAVMRGGQVVVADRFFASSKTCSACGRKVDALPLAVRKWTCAACGVLHNRDVNAAVNLKNMAVSSTVAACGEEGSGSGRKTRVKPSSAKQEVSGGLAQQ